MAASSASIASSSAFRRAFLASKSTAACSSGVSPAFFRRPFGFTCQRPAAVSRSRASSGCITVSPQKLSSTKIRSGLGRSLLRCVNMFACGMMRMPGLPSRYCFRKMHCPSTSNSQIWSGPPSAF